MDSKLDVIRRVWDGKCLPSDAQVDELICWVRQNSAQCARPGIGEPYCRSCERYIQIEELLTRLQPVISVMRDNAASAMPPEVPDE